VRNVNQGRRRPPTQGGYTSSGRGQQRAPGRAAPSVPPQANSYNRGPPSHYRPQQAPPPPASVPPPLHNSYPPPNQQQAAVSSSYTQEGRGGSMLDSLCIVVVLGSESCFLCSYFSVIDRIFIEMTEKN